MRRKTVIYLLMFAIVFAMADTHITFFPLKDGAPVQDSTVNVDTLFQNMKVNYPTTTGSKTLSDTTEMDSLKKAIYQHNKAIDDSIRADSILRSRSNGIESPVSYSAEDSLVYDALTGVAHLYGTSKVDYQNMNLASDKIDMSLDSNLVRAVGTPDSTEENGIKGKPTFKMGEQEYTSDTMAYNFKSKKRNDQGRLHSPRRWIPERRTGQT